MTGSTMSVNQTASSVPCNGKVVVAGPSRAEARLTRINALPLRTG